MRYKNDAFKIAFSGIMLSLVLLFQFIERYWDLHMGYVKLNISIVFIASSCFILGFRWGVLILALRLVIAPSISSLGYSGIGMWAQFALFIYDSIFMFILYFSIKLFGNKYFSTAIATGSIVIISGFLNGILITPVFWKLQNFQPTASFEDSFVPYSYVKPLMFFGIPNYWAGMFVVYGIANLIKFTISSFLFLALWKVMITYIDPKIEKVTNKEVNIWKQIRLIFKRA